MRHYYACELLNAVCEAMKAPKTPCEFVEVFRVEAVDEERLRAVRSLYRRQLWRAGVLDFEDLEC